MKWCKDSFAEQTMKKFGLTWETKDVPVDQIDWTESRRNGARLGVAVDDDHVIDLAIAIQNGDTMPMPVFLVTGANKYVIISGNHRCPAAKECGADTITAYVVKSTDEAVIFALPCALNPPIRPQVREDRLKMATVSVEKGLTVDEASYRFCLPKGLIQDEISITQTRNDLGKLGVPGDKFGKSTIRHLRPIKNTNVLASAARLVLAAKMTGTETDMLSKEIREAKTEAQQIAVIAEKEKAIGASASEPKPQHAKRVPAVVIKMALGTLEKHANVRTINQWGITDKGAKIDFIARIRRLAGKLTDICKRSDA